MIGGAEIGGAERVIDSFFAEGVGFEPTEACTSHAFQACPFGRSGNPPGTPWCGYRLKRIAWIDRSRFGVWRSGPVQQASVNRVRAGRQQLSAEPLVCRR